MAEVQNWCDLNPLLRLSERRLNIWPPASGVAAWATGIGAISVRTAMVWFGEGTTTLCCNLVSRGLSELSGQTDATPGIFTRGAGKRPVDVQKDL